jgi:hypothetical protein
LGANYDAHYSASADVEIADRALQLIAGGYRKD